MCVVQTRRTSHVGAFSRIQGGAEDVIIGRSPPVPMHIVRNFVIPEPAAERLIRSKIWMIDHFCMGEARQASKPHPFPRYGCAKKKD